MNEIVCKNHFNSVVSAIILSVQLSEGTLPIFLNDIRLMTSLQIDAVMID